MIFKIYDYRILGAVLLIWTVLLFVPIGLVPDYLNLTMVIKSGTFARISLSFISVFSFLVTVLILTYGFLREKFRRLTLHEFLDNKYSRLLISSFISVFLLNIFSALYLDSHTIVDDHVLNIAYYTLYLSILYFCGFLPVALISISYADSQNLIGKYNEQLSLNYFPENHSHELTVTHNEHNPLVVLINLVRSYAEKDDFHSINTIIFSSQQKIEQLIGDSKDRAVINRYLTGQRLIWDTVVHKAFQKKEYSVINSIFLALSSYHYFFSKKDIPLLYLQELRFFTHSLMERLVSEGISDSVEQAIVIHEKILEYHYDNSAPAESDLKELKHFFEQSEESYQEAYGKLSTVKDIDYIHLQWQKIYSDIPYVFSVIIYKAIEKKNAALFERALDALSHLIHAVYLSRLSDRQKAWIIRIASPAMIVTTDPICLSER